MPDLIKLLVRHALIGFALAALLVGCMWHFNIGNFTHLIKHTDNGVVALLMLTAFLGLTFASAQMGIAVMLAGRDDDDDAHPGSMVAAVGHEVLEFVRAGKQPGAHKSGNGDHS